jgi:hypothetical protein
MNTRTDNKIDKQLRSYQVSELFSYPKAVQMGNMGVEWGISQLLLLRNMLRSKF